jgi:hypothetical protein
MIGLGSTSSSAPADYRFPREVIAVAVRWYLRFSLSYRDGEELLAERGMPPGTVGSSTRPTSRSPAGGSTCTAQSISAAK